jgi:hypothetical protein
MFLAANYYHIALAASDRTASRLFDLFAVNIACLQPNELCMLALACMLKLVASAGKLDGSMMVSSMSKTLLHIGYL